MNRRNVALILGGLASVGLGLGLWLGLSGGGKAEPTRQDYLARVSSVCRTYARRLERVPAPSDPGAYGDVIDSLRRVVPLLRAQATAMRAEPAPAALEPRLERLFGLDRRSIGQLEVALAAAEHRDAGRVATGLARFASLRDRVHVAALALGIRCEAN